MSERCGRFEGEGVALLEDGLPLPPHFSNCPECRKARAEYDRLAKALASAGTPPPAEPRREAWTRRSNPRWRWAAAAAAAVAAMGLAARWWPRRAPPPEHGQPALALRLAVVPAAGARSRRGAAPDGFSNTLFLQGGDKLSFEAYVGAAPHAEVRIYREDRELELSCPPGCRREQERLVGEIELRAPGRYQAYAVASTRSIPAPAANPSEDTDRLFRAGARIAPGPPVRVY